MRRATTIVIAMLLAIIASNAIAVTPGQYQWEQQRSRTKLSADEQKLPELMIKNHVLYEYTFENDEFLMYSTHHKIIYVNSNEAIQKHNRIYISMNNTMGLTAVKARAINKAGKAVYFDETNLKEIKEEASGNAYRIFAMEGVEIGSEVEYYYTRKMVADMFNREFMQFDVPARTTSMKLTSPKHLKFDFKTYNGLPEVQQAADTTQNVYELSASNVVATKEEPFAYLTANRKRVEYKLAYNTARSRARLYTWADASKRFYEILTTLTKDDKKAVEKFVNSAKVDKSLKPADRIKKIEGILKTSINVNDESGDQALGAPELILKNKVASREGITRLYMAVFTQMGIKAFPVLTCSRDRFRFDGDFDTWSYLDDYMIYFPETKGFIAPYFPTRYPLVPGAYTAQKALFVEPFEVGEVKSALGTINEIPAPGYLANQDNLNIDVKFDEGLESNTINQTRSFVGYSADYFVTFYQLMNDEKRKQMVEELFKETAPDAQVDKWSAKPVAKGDVDWFEMQADFKTSTFIEKAGPRILFKAGLLIGPQIEMYRDEHRVSAVENDNNRNYDRSIKIHLPQGYVVKNADQLKMNFTYSNDDKNPFIFKSDYVIKDGVLEITIAEFYKEIFVPLDRYEDFRKVVNASADFNKITLVLEKAR
ncbi:MAG TPA: DUF3857 domain-containing protein [Cyclobacteriaceae bacterium]